MFRENRERALPSASRISSPEYQLKRAASVLSQIPWAKSGDPGSFRKEAMAAPRFSISGMDSRTRRFPHSSWEVTMFLRKSWSRERVLRTEARSTAWPRNSVPRRRPAATNSLRRSLFGCMGEDEAEGQEAGLDDAREQDEALARKVEIHGDGRDGEGEGESRRRSTGRRPPSRRDRRRPGRRPGRRERSNGGGGTPGARRTGGAGRWR